MQEEIDCGRLWLRAFGMDRILLSKRRFPVQGRGDKVSVSYYEVKDFGDEEPWYD